MFNIDEVPTFTQTVSVTLPGGRVEEFQTRFEALLLDEYQGFDLRTADGTKDFLARVVLGVSDIVDRDKEPLPDTPELRLQLLNRSWVRTALAVAYHRGIGAALVGNS